MSAECVAFSPDGAHVATGGSDHTILIWEVPTILPPDKEPALSADEQDRWWTALGGDAGDAYKIVEQMMNAPKQSVAVLRERVKPVAAGDAKEADKRIPQLNSESYDERLAASKALEKMGDGVSHLLSKALDDASSLEVRHRLEALLTQCEEITVLRKQQLRSVTALEWIGSPEAVKLLRELAEGAPQARLTMEARGALKRLMTSGAASTK